METRGTYIAEQNNHNRNIFYIILKIFFFLQTWHVGLLGFDLTSALGYSACTSLLLISWPLMTKVVRGNDIYTESSLAPTPECFAAMPGELWELLNKWGDHREKEFPRGDKGDYHWTKWQVKKLFTSWQWSSSSTVKELVKLAGDQAHYVCALEGHGT